MNPAITLCTVPPGYYGGSYLPSFNQGQFGYPYPCKPVPGNNPVPFPGYGGPYPQPFFGPTQPCPSIPCAYDPHPGMFPPGYMVPQQAYPQPGMYGGPPMPPPLTQTQDGGAVQSSIMSPMSTVPRKCPPGFPQIPSGDISPAGMQWNTMVSHAGLHVPGISTTPDIEDKKDSDGSSSELWPPSSEHSTAGCQTTPDIKYLSDCQQTPDLTINTQLSRSHVLSEHSNESVVNAQTISISQKLSSCTRLVTDQKIMGTSTLYTPPVQEEEPISTEETGKEELYPYSFSNVSNKALSVPAKAVYNTTESDTTDGPTRSTWNAANKDFHLTYYRECLVCVLWFVVNGLGIPSGVPLKNKCWAVPWPITIV